MVPFNETNVNTEANICFGGRGWEETMYLVLDMFSFKVKML